MSPTTSWDVWKHQRLPFEIYGTEGSMLVPDPNFFGGAPMVSARDADWRELDITAHPFRVPNTLRSGAEVADYRIIGLLDMAAALQGRAHRANGDLALHVLEVLDAFERSSVEGRHVMIETPCNVRSRCRSAPATRCFCNSRPRWVSMWTTLHVPEIDRISASFLPLNVIAQFRARHLLLQLQGEGTKYQGTWHAVPPVTKTALHRAKTRKEEARGEGFGGAARAELGGLLAATCWPAKPRPERVAYRCFGREQRVCCNHNGAPRMAQSRSFLPGIAR